MKHTFIKENGEEVEVDISFDDWEELQEARKKFLTPVVETTRVCLKCEQEKPIENYGNVEVITKACDECAKVFINGK